MREEDVFSIDPEVAVSGNDVAVTVNADCDGIMRRVEAVFADAISRPILPPTEAEMTAAGLMLAEVAARDPDVESATYDAATQSVRIRFKGEAMGYPFLVTFDADGKG